MLGMRPKVASGASPSACPANARSSGTPKLARLSTLNASRRNSSVPLRRARTSGARLTSARSSVRRFGPVERAAPGVAERAGRLQHERRRVEPLVGTAEHGAVGAVAGRVARPVQADAWAARRRPLRARAVRGDEHRQRLAAAHGPDARQFQPPEQRAGSAGQAPGERQVPGHVHHPVVPRRGSRTGPCCSRRRTPASRRSCRWWRPRRRSTPAWCLRSSTTCRRTAPRGRCSSGGAARG